MYTKLPGSMSTLRSEKTVMFPYPTVTSLSTTAPPARCGGRLIPTGSVTAGRTVGYAADYGRRHDARSHVQLPPRTQKHRVNEFPGRVASGRLSAEPDRLFSH